MVFFTQILLALKAAIAFLRTFPVPVTVRLLMGAALAEVFSSTLSVCTLFSSIMVGFALAGYYVALAYKARLPTLTTRLAILLAILCNTVHFLPQNMRFIGEVDIGNILIILVATWLIEDVIHHLNKKR